MTDRYQENVATNENTPPYSPPDTGLRKGAFYWVRIVEGEDRASVIANSWQPARYTGRAGDTVGDTWDFLGYYSATGHHDVDVIQVGPEIVPVL